MQHWLSGKIGKKEDEVEQKDYYAIEMKHRQKQVADVWAAVDKLVNSPIDNNDLPSNVSLMETVGTVDRPKNKRRKTKVGA